MFSYLKTIADLYIPSIDEAEEGQGMVEYGLILVLVSVAAITVLGLFGPELINIFNDVLDGLRGEAGEG